MSYDVPDMSEKVCVVTGANTGIGKATAMELARAGAHVFLACRSEEKARAAIDHIYREAPDADIEFIELDLSSLDSVRRCARELLDRDLRLDVLINNAGLAGASGTTEEGFEMAFGVNHLGHFLLTSMLMERLEESAPARVVNVASNAHFKADGIDFEKVRKPRQTTTGMPEYAVSKLANIVFTIEAARRFPQSGVHFYSLHPGVVASDIWRRIPWPFSSLVKLFMIGTEEGAQTSLYCATSPDVAADNGLYYDECAEREPKRVAHDASLGEELWRRSVEWTGAETFSGD